MRERKRERERRQNARSVTSAINIFYEVFSASVNHSIFDVNANTHCTNDSIEGR